MILEIWKMCYVYDEIEENEQGIGWKGSFNSALDCLMDYSTSTSETSENVSLFVLILLSVCSEVCRCIQSVFDSVSKWMKLQIENIYWSLSKEDQKFT